MADDEDTTPPPFEATLRYKSEKIPLNLVAGNTVAELKELVVELIDDISEIADLRLVLGGKILADDDATMESLGIKEGSVINGAKAAKTTTAPPVTGEALATQLKTKPQPTIPGMPEGLKNNPMLQAMLNNPEMMRLMLESDPRIKEAMERQPELRQMLSDPSFLRQSLEIASNPAALQELQRNQDRALLNIENLPGGFQALSSLHNSLESLHRPRNENPSTDEANRRFAERLGVSPTTTDSSAGPNAAALPNPWAAPSATNQQQQAGSSSGFGMGLPGMGMGMGMGSGAGAGSGMMNAAMLQQQVRRPR